MKMTNPCIKYTITNNGTGINGSPYTSYTVRYFLNSEEQIMMQNEMLVLEKHDVDGSTSEASLPIYPASIVSYNGDSATSSRYQGFAVNVSDENLAVGGTYYSIESTVGTYGSASSDPNSSPAVTPPISSDT